MEPATDGGKGQTFRDSIDEKFAMPAGDPVPDMSSDPDWCPDVFTLRWLLHNVDTDVVIDAMRSDVPSRQQAAGDYTENTMWSFAADAAIEAILFPAIRRAIG